MLTPNLKLYASWNLQKPPIPPRSRLYHLQPMAMGTPYVESLTGYVLRLAQQHCITTRRLILTEVAPLMGRETKLSDSLVESISKVLGTDRDRTATNGMGLMATNLINALSYLTQRNDLHFLTFKPWATVLSKRGLLRHERAWCPSCYQEWCDTNKSIYEPLIWYINVVQICPIHYHLLLERCPHCLTQQQVISGDSIPGHCNKCGQWLGSYQHKTVDTSKFHGESEFAWQLDVANNVGELIAAAPTLKSLLDSSQISNTLSTYINQVFKSNNAAFSRFVGINKATISSWCQKKVIPQIDKLLLLSHYMEIKLLDFLTTDISVVELKQSSPELTEAKRVRKSYQKINPERKQVLNIVLQEVINEEPPPSLSDIAVRLKYRPLVLQYHFPELCHAIKVRHSDYRKVSKKQKIQPILEAALQEYPPPSLLEITRRLSYKNNSYLYKCFPELCRSISKRYQEFIYTTGQQKRERIRQEIIDVAQLLHLKGYKPTRRRVAELLSKPGVLLNSYARKTLQEVLYSLGYE